MCQSGPFLFPGLFRMTVDSGLWTIIFPLFHTTRRSAWASFAQTTLRFSRDAWRHMILWVVSLLRLSSKWFCGDTIWRELPNLNNFILYGTAWCWLGKGCKNLKEFQTPVRNSDRQIIHWKVFITFSPIPAAVIYKSRQYDLSIHALLGSLRTIAISVGGYSDNLGEICCGVDRKNSLFLPNSERRYSLMGSILQIRLTF